ncbi:hypothetical protein IMCC3317_03610 [Kordia antarctica]|uniref:DUF983 domain-containing protein n=1 Tax=Kordia antarctica TaxID=1218801 RepID=A0A7L4ZEF5_9FLAO|nr:DUF983 domain-containing protein [Kordia antarctica]QHI35015.1 hypothetical protein IMCC3317_03610 [Kordia antarctica]
MVDAILNVCKGTCPNCNSGSIFKQKGLFYKMRMPKMYEHCTVCNYKFEKEPGYFIGAMYVSYMLTVGQAVGVYLIFSYLFQIGNNFQIFLIIIATMIGLSFFNMRISRTIWINLFKT